MLVLRRKVAQTIVMNGTITVQILAIEGKQIKVGITAPPEMLIVRGELLTDPWANAAPSPDPQREVRRRPSRSYRRRARP
jgi:carbon storage regulator